MEDKTDKLQWGMRYRLKASRAEHSQDVAGEEAARAQRLGRESRKDPEREGTRNKLNCLEMTLVWNIFHY